MADTIAAPAAPTPTPAPAMNKYSQSNPQFELTHNGVEYAGWVEQDRLYLSPYPDDWSIIQELRKRGILPTKKEVEQE